MSSWLDYLDTCAQVKTLREIRNPKKKKVTK